MTKEGVIPLRDAPEPLADRRVFSSHGVVFTVADIVRHGRCGDRDTGSARTAAQVETDFRRARRLLTADQLTSWLTEWSIAPDDFRTWTEDVAVGRQDASGWCHLVCSGGFDAAGAAVATAVAAAWELGRGPHTAVDFDPAGWVDRLSAAIQSEPALRATVRQHRLDWSWITGTQVVGATRGVCAELRHCVATDGEQITTAAAVPGCAVIAVDSLLAQIEPPELQRHLAGARPGDIMGPVHASNGWNLVRVTGRQEPDPRDPEVRARAAEHLTAEALTRAVARHIGT